MEKSITVSIDNITEARFLLLWNFDYTPGIYEQRTKIILTIPLEKENVVDEIAQFAEQHKLSYNVFYQAYDFNRTDLRQAPLLEIGAGSLDGTITVVEDRPIKNTHCAVCGSITTHFDASVKKILCKAKRKPKDLIISDEDGYLLLFHRTLLDKFRNTGCAKGLETMACAITAQGEVDENYFWPYSGVSLGFPSGNIVYDQCTACSFKIVRHRRDFITHYSDAAWKESDFAVSFSLVISQRVFQLLENKIPKKVFDKLSFEPCLLD